MARPGKGKQTLMASMGTVGRSDLRLFFSFLKDSFIHQQTFIGHLSHARAWSSRADKLGFYSLAQWFYEQNQTNSDLVSGQSLW
jgi:hypothetical protein